MVLNLLCSQIVCAVESYDNEIDPNPPNVYLVGYYTPQYYGTHYSLAYFSRVAASKRPSKYQVVGAAVL